MNKTYLQRGMTMVELMITLSIVSVLVMLAGPNFMNQVNNNKSLTLSENMLGALNYARSEAIKRQARVSVCALSSVQGNTCGTDWTNGWIVFLDSAASDTAASATIGNAATDILKRWDATGNSSIYSLSEGKTFIRYTSLGTLAQTGSQSSATIDTYYLKCKGDNRRQLTIINSGMIRVQKLDCP